MATAFVPLHGLHHNWNDLRAGWGERRNFSLLACAARHQLLMDLNTSNFELQPLPSCTRVHNA